eukprot:scaffold34606_cov192-Amphora_coffeaeformis.AAC.10
MVVTQGYIIALIMVYPILVKKGDGSLPSRWNGCDRYGERACGRDDSKREIFIIVQNTESFSKNDLELIGTAQVVVSLANKRQRRKGSTGALASCFLRDRRKKWGQFRQGDLSGGENFLTGLCCAEGSVVAGSFETSDEAGIVRASQEGEGGRRYGVYGGVLSLSVKPSSGPPVAGSPLTIESSEP